MVVGRTPHPSVAEPANNHTHDGGQDHHLQEEDHESMRLRIHPVHEEHEEEGEEDHANSLVQDSRIEGNTLPIYYVLYTICHRYYV